MTAVRPERLALALSACALAAGCFSYNGAWGSCYGGKTRACADLRQRCRAGDHEACWFLSGTASASISDDEYLENVRAVATQCGPRVEERIPGALHALARNALKRRPAVARQALAAACDCGYSTECALLADVLWAANAHTAAAQYFAKGCAADQICFDYHPPEGLGLAGCSTRRGYACERLAAILQAGDGLPRDVSKAAMLLRRAGTVAAEDAAGIRQAREDRREARRWEREARAERQRREEERDRRWKEMTRSLQHPSTVAPPDAAHSPASPAPAQAGTGAPAAGASRPRVDCNHLGGTNALSDCSAECWRSCGIDQALCECRYNKCVDANGNTPNACVQSCIDGLDALSHSCVQRCCRGRGATPAR